VSIYFLSLLVIYFVVLFHVEFDCTILFYHVKRLE